MPVSVLLLRSQGQRPHLNRVTLTTRKFSRKSRLENDFFFISPVAPRDQEDIVEAQDPQERLVNQERSVHREVLDPRADPVLKVLLDPRALPWKVTGNNVFIKIWTKKKTLA